MTRAELLALVRQQTLISSTELSDAAVYSLLTQGLNDVAVRYPRWPWCHTAATIELVDGTASYALPTNLIALESVSFVGQGRSPLVRTTREDVVRQYGETPGDADIPTMYYQYGQQITFVPTPDDSTQDVKITFFQMPASSAFDETTEEPPFNVAFHPLLADFAAAMIWEREEMEEKAQFYWGRYFDAINRMAQFYAIQLPSAPLIIGQGMRFDRLVPWRNYIGA